MDSRENKKNDIRGRVRTDKRVSPRSSGSYAKHLDFILMDIAIITLCYLAVTTVWFWSYHHRAMPPDCRLLCLIVFLVSIFIHTVHSFHSGVLERDRFQEMRVSAIYTSLVWIVTIVLAFITRMPLVSRPTVMISWPLTIFLLYLFHSWRKRALLRFLSDEDNLEHVILVTTSDNLERGYEKLYRNQMNRYFVKAIFLTDSTPDASDYRNVPLYSGGEKEIYDYVLENIVDRVDLDLNDTNLQKRLINELTLMGTVVSIPLLRDIPDMPNEHIENYNGDIFIAGSIAYATTQQIWIKRFIDVVGSLIGLVITGILILIYAPIIKIQSPGPIFFSQERVGMNGRKFRIWKFRTMYPDADKEKDNLQSQNKMTDGLMFKLDDDPRVIPIGRFMRKHSIDEFPQFYNVLINDMSLVGTRPPTVDEYEKYNYNHRARLSIKPGLTGLWQVSGRSNITDFEDVVALDVMYIREWSLRLDARILWKTIVRLFRPEGAE